VGNLGRDRAEDAYGERGEIRTHDQRLKRPLLYRLSYAPSLKISGFRLSRPDRENTISLLATRAKSEIMRFVFGFVKPLADDSGFPRKSGTLRRINRRT
jgi:hypothetical protein